MKRTHSEHSESAEESSSTESNAALPSATPLPFREASTSKKVALEASTSEAVLVRCFLPPHETLSFSSYQDYDDHYQSAHVNRCIECGTNFPSDHFLNLHIAENHDPLTESKRARGEKTYACILPTCDRFCSTPAKRRLHCLAKHDLPYYYNFDIIDTGLDDRNSMFKPRRRAYAPSSTSSPRKPPSGSTADDPEVGRRKPKLGAMERVNEMRNAVDGTTADERMGRKEEGAAQRVKANEGETMGKEDDGLDDVVKGMSALKFVPRSVMMKMKKG